MDDPCKRYKSQLKKAKETLQTLYIQRDEINLKLIAKPSSASVNKALREVNMDIRITDNEIEHAEYSIKKCELQNFSVLE